MRTDDIRPVDTAATHIEEPTKPTMLRPVTERWDALGWAKKNLFNTVPNTILSILILWLLWTIVPSFLDWTFISAVWTADTSEACKVEGVGACWAFVEEKHRFILFGVYPFAEQWRPFLAVMIFLFMIVTSAYPAFWRPWLAGMWTIGLVLCGILMWGGALGLTAVPTEKWGGLPLTLLLAVSSLILQFPLAVLLALGRRSDMPVIRAICVTFIEAIRGVPLISVLFMASVMFPLFLPEGVNFDKLLRAIIGMTLFAAAYGAEAIRGGLQALPRGQYEAADALGLGYWQKTWKIILPQALKVSIPPLVNQFISTFKDTSLVLIIGLFDLLNTAKSALADPPWRQFYIESYVFIAIIYFAFCFFMSRYSQYLERRLNTGHSS